MIISFMGSSSSSPSQCSLFQYIFFAFLLHCHNPLNNNNIDRIIDAITPTCTNVNIKLRNTNPNLIDGQFPQNVSKLRTRTLIQDETDKPR